MARSHCARLSRAATSKTPPSPPWAFGAGASFAGPCLTHFDDYVAAGGDAADEAAFWNSFRAGQRAGEFTLLRLGDGAQVRLSELWGAKPLVMEFGSFT